MKPPLLGAYIDWYCPACGKTERTRSTGKPESRFHTCPKLRFLSAPMTQQGIKAKVELNERGDYIGGDTVRLDPERHRPVMNLTRTRDDGTDAWVFAPTATAKGD